MQRRSSEIVSERPPAMAVNDHRPRLPTFSRFGITSAKTVRDGPMPAAIICWSEI
jgi:hypothetical protein